LKGNCLLVECKTVEGLQGSYSELMRALRTSTKMLPEAYTLPNHQPLYIDTDVAYCLDRSTCSVFLVAIRCLPLMPCTLYVSKFVTDVNAESAEYRRHFSAFIEQAVNEVLPRDPNLQKELFRRFFRDLLAGKPQGIAGAVANLMESPAYERLMKGLARFIQTYGPRILPEPEGIARELAENCPKSFLAQYVRAVRNLRQLSHMFRVLSIVSGR